MRSRDKLIEDVEVGDEVSASRAEPLMPAGHLVSALVRGFTEIVVRISVNAANVVATRGHPFHVVGQGWTEAASLRVGDLLTEAAGLELRVSGVEHVHLPERTATYNLTVADVSTYFVRLGEGWILVHNSGSGPYNQTLYWVFGKKINLRPSDTDGLSVWKTTSKEEVDTLLSHRVNVNRKSLNDPHGYFTQADLDNKRLVAPATPSTDALANKLPHHSLRPQEAPDYPAELTEEQMTSTKGTLGDFPPQIVKPKELPC